MAAMFNSRKEAMAWLKATKERKRRLEEESQIILEKIHNDRLNKTAYV